MVRIAQGLWLGFAALLLFAPSASAVGPRRIARASHATREGPLIVGRSALAWSDEACLQCDGDYDTYRLFYGRRGRRPVLVAHSAVGAETGDNGISNAAEASFVGSSSRLVELYDSSGSSDDGDDDDGYLLAARPGRRLRRLAHCEITDEDESAYYSMSIDGPRLALVEAGCGAPAPEAIAVRDLAAGTREVVATGSRGRVLGLAGRYLAAEITYPGLGDRIVVFDRISHATVYSVPAPGTTGYVIGSDLDGAGTLALTLQPPEHRIDCDRSLVYYSRAEPRAHVVANHACSDSVRLAGDRAIVRFGSLQRPELRSVALHGGPTHAVLKGRALQSDGFDVAAGRLAVGIVNCTGGYDMDLLPLTGTPVSESSPACPARPGREVLGANGRHVVVPLRCPRGCHGAVSLRRGRTLYARSAFRLPRGRSGPRLALRRKGRLGLARYGARRIRVTLVTRDRAGRRHRTSAVVTLTR